jgi:hypothetical protein
MSSKSPTGASERSASFASSSALEKSNAMRYNWGIRFRIGFIVAWLSTASVCRAQASQLFEEAGQHNNNVPSTERTLLADVQSSSSVAPSFSVQDRASAAKVEASVGGREALREAGRGDGGGGGGDSGGVATAVTTDPLTRGLLQRTEMNRVANSDAVLNRKGVAKLPFQKAASPAVVKDLEEFEQSGLGSIGSISSRTGSISPVEQKQQSANQDDSRTKGEEPPRISNKGDGGTSIASRTEDAASLTSRYGAGTTGTDSNSDISSASTTTTTTSSSSSSSGSSSSSSSSGSSSSFESTTARSGIGSISSGDNGGNFHTRAFGSEEYNNAFTASDNTNVSPKVEARAYRLLVMLTHVIINYYNNSNETPQSATTFEMIAPCRFTGVPTFFYLSLVRSRICFEAPLTLFQTFFFIGVGSI